MRLLWVENHAVFARMAGRQFLAADNLTIVPSLAQARELLTAMTFHVVLLDYDLNDGKGTSLIEVIRKLPSIPLVVATSAHEEGNRLLLAAGADAVCPKSRFGEMEKILSRVAHVQGGKADDTRNGG